MKENKLRLEFHGATGFVTGSRMFLEYKGTRILIDCGLYQGGGIENKNNEPLSFDPCSITAIVLTHAHVDHSGLVPSMIKQGFCGKVYATKSTCDLLAIIWPDSGRIIEAEFHKKTARKKDNANYSLLYNEDDAILALNYLVPIKFNHNFHIGNYEIEFFWAGHILGAAHVRVKFGNKSCTFSGDIGPSDHMLHCNRTSFERSDFLVVESTYGESNHELDFHKKKIQEALRHIIDRNGVLLVPAFAIGRTQLVLYVLYKMAKDKEIPTIATYLDSPMAQLATATYLNYPEELKQEVIESGFLDYLSNGGVTMVESALASKALNDIKGPAIIMAASGMCHGGRIVYHLYHRLWDPRNYVLITGYQAEGTLGRQLVEGQSRVKILDKEILLRAKVNAINSFSAHAGRDDLIAWIKNQIVDDGSVIFINHGEDLARKSLATVIEDSAMRIEIPGFQSIFYL